MRKKRNILYSVIILGDNEVTEELGECLTACTTNLSGLSRLTGIKRDRLVYVFTRLKKSVLVEAGNVITKSTHLYRGNQEGRDLNDGRY